VSSFVVVLALAVVIVTIEVEVDVDVVRVNQDLGRVAEAISEFGDLLL
jgi:hypothetical protein